MVVWCTPGGARPHVLTLLEQSYCMLVLARSYYNENRGGANYLCLPEQPENLTYTAGRQGGRAYLHGTEYETGGGGDGPF